MNLKNYSVSDINMYLSNTYTMYDNKPVKISGFEEHEDRDVLYMHYRVNDGSRKRTNMLLVSTKEDFKLNYVPLGYYTVNNFVVYLYKYQNSHFKKLACNETLRCFIPQDRELDILRVSYNINYEDILLKGQEFLSLEEAYEKMKSKKVFSVALHHNYALVKKGTKKELVIYYKTDPVITYDGKNLKAIVDDCHVTKFKLELGICD